MKKTILMALICCSLVSVTGCSVSSDKEVIQEDTVTDTSMQSTNKSDDLDEVIEEIDNIKSKPYYEKDETLSDLEKENLDILRVDLEDRINFYKQGKIKKAFITNIECGGVSSSSSSDYYFAFDENDEDYELDRFITDNTEIEIADVFKTVSSGYFAVLKIKTPNLLENAFPDIKKTLSTKEIGNVLTLHEETIVDYARSSENLTYSENYYILKAFVNKTEVRYNTSADFWNAITGNVDTTHYFTYDIALANSSPELLNNVTTFIDNSIKNLSNGNFDEFINSSNINDMYSNYSFEDDIDYINQKELIQYIAANTDVDVISTYKGSEYESITSNEKLNHIPTVLLLKQPNINGFLREKVVEGLTIAETVEALEEAMQTNSIPKKELLMEFSLNSNLDGQIKSLPTSFAEYFLSACKTEFKFLNDK